MEVGAVVHVQRGCASDPATLATPDEVVLAHCIKGQVSLPIPGGQLTDICCSTDHCNSSQFGNSLNISLYEFCSSFQKGNLETFMVK